MIMLGEITITMGLDEDGDKACEFRTQGTLGLAELVGMLEVTKVRILAGQYNGADNDD